MSLAFLYISTLLDMAKSGRGGEWKNLGDVNGTLFEAHGECRA